ncbi:peptidoglycan-binding domain-containing protein [Nitrosomonas communis]|uniref:peptidoglycan-binding domain-containing protein n=1 Tax=Nitrosomonas communis TaxID=44574 RepID=UPI003D271C5C
MINIRYSLIISLIVSIAMVLSPVTQAAEFNQVTQQAQIKLAQLGFAPGTADGILGPRTSAAIKAFQRQSGLPETGKLDNVTLKQLELSTPAPQVSTVEDWRSVPSQDELDDLVAHTINNPNFPYTDYRPNAPAANLDLPGLAILAAMKTSSDTFGSGPPGTPNSTPKTRKTMTDCLMTKPTHWADITLHYYCQMALPRQCYTYALRGMNTPGNKKFTRVEAYESCALNKLPHSTHFTFVTKTQPQVFQYVMFGQTNAFKPEQEQAIINAFYGVKNPADPRECRLKRPRRAEDPNDGTHCLVNKKMTPMLKGKDT